MRLLSKNGIMSASNFANVGQLDSTLNTNVYDIAPAMDGSGDLYVGGIFEKYDGAAMSGTVRLNNDGSRDAAFEVGTGFRL